VNGHSDIKTHVTKHGVNAQKKFSDKAKAGGRGCQEKKKGKGKKYKRVYVVGGGGELIVQFRSG